MLWNVVAFRHNDRIHFCIDKKALFDRKNAYYHLLISEHNQYNNKKTLIQFVLFDTAKCIDRYLKK